jgi:hypothetical protein
VIGFLISFPLYGQDSLNNESLELKEDSSAVLLKKWKDSRDFSYMNYLDSLLKVQKKLVVDTVRIDRNTGKVIRQEQEEKSVSFLSRIFKSSGTGLFLRILAIFFILFILSKVFIQSGFFSFGGKRKSLDSPGSEEEPFKEREEYERLIREAEKSNELNLATRYGYLKIMKTLADKELIQFSMDKTNEDFIRELQDHFLQKEFGEITRIYEYVWYGEIFLKNDMYDKIKFSFEKFDQQLINEG